MNRILALSVAAVVMLFSQASSALAGDTTIKIEGQLTGNNFISATCTLGNNGTVAGTGVLYGVNPSNGYKYQYPFTISKATTVQGKLVLSGKINNGPNLTLSCTVPNGAMSFSYVINGNTYVLSGQGSVLLK